jgi:hypothetical protein
MLSTSQIKAKLEGLEARWGHLPHQKLIVRAWLYSPIGYDVIGKMPLDDLLCVAVLDYAGIHIDDLPEMRPLPVAIPLPLAKRHIGGSWMWSASWVKLPYEAIEITRAKRKHYREHPVVQHKVVDPSMGPFRSYNLCTSAMATPCVEWVVGGHKETIETLLQYLPVIGRARNSGIGSVQFWETSPTELDPVLQDGVPQRQIPFVWEDRHMFKTGSFATAFRRIRPPYVHACTETLCVVPV